ncbi:hypothetical protein ACS0TY_018126 [Phlomoides rotata]
MVQQTMSGRWTPSETQFFCFVFFILVSQLHGCNSLNSEGYALLQFRAKVVFDPSGALDDWNPNHCNPCTWSGVHCLDGRVYMLDLNGQELEGVLVPELGNLTHLRVLNLSENHLSGTIPQEFGQLTTLEVLDLRNNKFFGIVPAELGRLHSLKRLLLCNNSFEGRIPAEIGKLSLLTDLRCDDILTTASAGFGCMNRKFGHCIWQSVIEQSQKSNSFQVPIKGTIIRYLNLFPLFKFGSESLHDQPDDSPDNSTDLPESALVLNVNNQVRKRRILVEQSSNLVAIPPSVTNPVQLEATVGFPSRSSGSFPAVPNKKKLSPTPAPATSPSSPQVHKINGADAIQPASGKSGNSLKLIVGLSVLVFLLVVAGAMFAICRSRAAKTIGPWKTGLSGQLQKAFVTGVPKLNRGELETACEDFSNIITVDDGVATFYKGTLSSGVEIAVVSTVIGSLKDWSKRSELLYRKKIDSLSRLNHKNFLNLIGYCEEEEPFTRMMVFEYAPNGSLYEHLNDREVEHLDWNARVRIIMGSAYFLQHVHDLNPPFTHFNLTSKEILLTDDYAAKIADIKFWAELVAKSKNPTENESEHSEVQAHAHGVETNVYSFGVLLLEIISGKLPYSEEPCLINWAVPYLNDKRRLSRLVDPTLKCFKENEVEVICEAIQSCIHEDARKRPCMKEVIEILKKGIDISPDAATPRLSPLWWAELEILSAEAS